MSDNIPQHIKDEADLFAATYPASLNEDEINGLHLGYISGRMKSEGELIELITWFNLDSLKLNPCTDSANIRKWWSDRDNRSYTNVEILQLFQQSKATK